MLEFIILGTLYTNSLTGYDIRKCIEEGIGMFYKASYGSIYPILGKLLERGYVICDKEEQSKRNSKKYSITEHGRDEFIKWLKDDNDKSGSSIELFMAKVFFFDKLPSNLAYRKIDEYEERLIAYQRKLIKKKEKYENLDNIDPFYFQMSTLYFGLCKLQSIILWCETVKQGKKLENIKII